MALDRIGVVGAGQMGNGIAQVAAQAGLKVDLFDVSGAQLEKAVQTISSSADRLIKKGAMTEEVKGQVLSRIKTTTQMADLKGAGMIVEAATENVELKLKIFRQLDEVTGGTSLLVTNTSSISITKIAAVTRHPENVCGMHFMNPVPLMKLVEGIRGLQTSDQTFQTVKTLAEKMGKTFIEGKDYPGFIVNRILMPMINEAVYAFMEGVSDPKGIDEAMKLGTNQPMGPLTLADFIGLDTCLAIMNVLHEGLGDSKYRPCPLLVKYVEAG
ncbi:MAG: 3-hydroxybutyryl-CoA dehydrogenase, partial [Bdellovibrionales bacterium]|nr:3-hydroxybutyryl-CoA dehydrogenase [Bdellovibrionales bacterium]